LGRTAAVGAADVFIQNAGFELPDTANPDVSTTGLANAVPGWSTDHFGDSGVWDINNFPYGLWSVPAPEGKQVLYVGYSYTTYFEQTVGLVYPNSTYTLSGMEGNPAGYTTDYTVELRSGDNVLATSTAPGTTGDFQSFQLTFDSAGSASVGQVLTIRFTSAIQSCFDDIKLTSTVAPVPGDLNVDLQVDLTDYGILNAQWLQTGAGLQADLNHDGVVNLFDFGQFKVDYHAFNGGGGSDLPVPTGVPEPAAWVLAVAVVPALICLRRRSRKRA
jgi:HpiC1 cyclase/Dockerin type I domain